MEPESFTDKFVRRTEKVLPSIMAITALAFMGSYFWTNRPFDVSGEVVKEDRLRVGGIHSLVNLSGVRDNTPAYSIRTNDGGMYLLLSQDGTDLLNVGDKKTFHVGKSWGVVDGIEMRYMRGFE